MTEQPEVEAVHATEPTNAVSDTVASATVGALSARQPKGLSRRGMLALTGGLGLAVGAVAGAGTATAITANTPSGSSDSLEYPFFAEHQGGVVTPAQDRLHFAAYNLRDDVTREDLIELLQDWTYAASRDRKSVV